ncbi:DNA/RNA non-specific endonuclease [Roseovarius aestuarii]|uniref:DNA/RNA non-specific endonuclease n=1 Tax=Roseovarius aestuarii TaxID=475083 RepID=A0A1X7BRS6_9RHOB|nr:DNA/RNA non-specific endonuclease [Roseovarius aestuarii]SMC12264.1 DNA/RNA non-specific endonuclease [Roseovarius aestuarii]
MTNGDTSESINRLGRLSQDGTFDKVLSSIRSGNPVLEEMKLTEDRLREALNAPMDGLESVGLVPGELEAIIELVGRPPLVVQNDKVQGKTTLDDFFPDNIGGKIARVEKFLPSVGRIEFFNHDRAWGGTGWVIDEDGSDHLLVVTNRHVAKFVARRNFRGEAVYAYGPGNVRYGARIDFVEEVDIQPDPGRVFVIEEFTYLADDISADVALGRIARNTGMPRIAPLPLAETDGEDGETVGLVGYPAYDSRNEHQHMDAYFKDLYDVKRFAPGYLIKGDELGILSHDCTSLGGNSGSPLISLDRGVALGLHFAGRYGVANSAVRASTLKGILAGQSQMHVIAALTGQATEAADRAHATDFFAGRDGYDPDFLQEVTVPLPDLPVSLELAAPEDATPERPHELRYQHFGVLYSARNKGPAVTAFNIDGSRFHAIKRHNSTWFHDLRIPRDIQLDREAYGHARIDRGHMVRRFATNWGTEDEAKRANLDSYHYTNASPQHASLNRSRAKWLGLEDYILSSTRTHGFRANVFTGPVYTPDDPELGTSGAPLPLHFWKVVTMLTKNDCGEMQLHATAYVLSQGQLIQQMLQEDGLTESTEGFEFGEFKTFQIRIADLEAMTGYDFGALREHDPLNTLAQTETAITAKPVIELDALRQIVL